MSKTVVIVGAGIVGVSTAIWLQRAGHAVTLIDRKGPGEGTSHGNGGVLASAALVPVPTPGLWKRAPRMLLDPHEPLFLKWGYLPRLLPWLTRYMGEATAEGVAKRARAILPIIGDSLNDHIALSKGTGAERFVVPSDYLYVYDTHKDYLADGATWQVKRDAGFDCEVMDGPAFHAYDPSFGPAYQCAVRQKDHGRISDPGAYVKALAAHVETEGGRILRGDVTDIARENGRVTGVRVSGEHLACDAVVLAAGAWSAGLARQLGVTVPMESERGYHLELWEPSVMPRAPVMIASGKFVATPMDGRLRLAGIVEFGGLDAPASKAPFALLENNIRKAIPGITWKRRVEWMGHRPSMSDSLPMIGAVPGAQGAFAGFGHDHVGLTGGPKTGRLLAQLISGTTPNIDLAPYSPSRFR
ncbi:D-amino-acid dehydrogenase [Sagittula marina]|uniref:D-amino-acid dehydrogenase n=2 Tax=Sagittula marina TaxID=943940 RepID=A0A7W6DPM2_9RHOB|nr:FAD-dependent oxidoreductase [Sagittula marina]MBB3986950.1 D-amino-acid dehydrogenase [Sagittula marina]